MYVSLNSSVDLFYRLSREGSGLSGHVHYKHTELCGFYPNMSCHLKTTWKNSFNIEIVLKDKDQYGKYTHYW